MILSKKVKLRITPSNFKKFKGKIGDIIEISTFELSKGSHTKIEVKCDNCNKESEVKWNVYIKNYSNGDWLCRDCKRKKNLKEKHGVENVFQLESTKVKSKKTMIKKYGVDNISKLESIKEKKIKTNIEKNGVDHYMQLEENKMYGKDNISNIKEVKLKKRNKWDNLSPTEKNEIHTKRINTNIERNNNCGPSSKEIEISNFIESIYNGEVIKSDT